MTHEELAARIERAEGPDRALDAEIYYDVLGFCRHANKVRSGAQSDTGFDCVDCGADSWGNLGKHGQKLHDARPAYTASMDAAMQLVPAGHNWAIDTGHKKGISAWCFDGHLWNTDASVASTPALALPAAAIRARSAS